MRAVLNWVVVIVSVISGVSKAEDVSSGGAWVEAELGPVWQGRNDVQIPVDSGDRFSLTQFGTGPLFASRFYIGYAFNERNEIRGLYAPLSIDLSGRLAAQVSFQGETFAADTGTEALYRFNSYRLTYRYRFIHDDRWTLKAGLTAKIRDAEISLKQGALIASRANVGFVPLLNVAVSYSLGERWGLLLDADALAAPQGRAEDVALFATYQPLEDVQFRLGYRTIEGGSDGGGEVYNFAWLHFIALGAKIDL